MTRRSPLLYHCRLCGCWKVSGGRSHPTSLRSRGTPRHEPLCGPVSVHIPVPLPLSRLARGLLDLHLTRDEPGEPHSLRRPEGLLPPKRPGARRGAPAPASSAQLCEGDQAFCVPVGTGVQGLLGLSDPTRPCLGRTRYFLIPGHVPGLGSTCWWCSAVPRCPPANCSLRLRFQRLLLWGPLLRESPGLAPGDLCAGSAGES